MNSNLVLASISLSSYEIDWCCAPTPLPPLLMIGAVLTAWTVGLPCTSRKLNIGSGVMLPLERWCRFGLEIRWPNKKNEYSVNAESTLFVQRWQIIIIEEEIISSFVLA